MYIWHHMYFYGKIPNNVPHKYEANLRHVKRSPSAHVQFLVVLAVN